MPDTITQDQLKTAVFEAFKALYYGDKANHQAYRDIFPSEEKFNVCFDAYFNSVMTQFSDASRNLLLTEYSENNQVKTDRIQKFANDMARSLNSFIGKQQYGSAENIGFEAGELKAGVIENATASLSTDFSASFDRLQTYSQAISSLFDEKFKNSKYYTADDIATSLANHISQTKISPHKKVNLSTTAAPILFALKGPANLQLIKAGNLSDAQVQNYCLAYANIVSKMISKLTTQKAPFVQSQGTQKFINNELLTATLGAAAELAMTCIDQKPDPKTTKEQEGVGAAIVDALVNDQKISSDYAQGFPRADSDAGKIAINTIREKAMEAGTAKMDDPAEPKRESRRRRAITGAYNLAAGAGGTLKGTLGRSRHRRPTISAVSTAPGEPMTDEQYAILKEANAAIQAFSENPDNIIYTKLAVNFNGKFHTDDGVLKEKDALSRDTDFVFLAHSITALTETPTNAANTNASKLQATCEKLSERIKEMSQATPKQKM